MIDVFHLQILMSFSTKLLVLSKLERESMMAAKNVNIATDYTSGKTELSCNTCMVQPMFV